jgi:hypothetical protein
VQGMVGMLTYSTAASSAGGLCDAADEMRWHHAARRLGARVMPARRAFAAASAVHHEARLPAHSCSVPSSDAACCPLLKPMELEAQDTCGAAPVAAVLLWQRAAEPPAAAVMLLTGQLPEVVGAVGEQATGALADAGTHAAGGATCWGPSAAAGGPAVSPGGDP